MAEFKIVWSSLAQIDLLEIMEYYFQRNKSISYSKSLSKKINADIEKLALNPNLGRESDFDKVRVLISGHYHIFYEIMNKKIFIMIIWDSRRNPNDLNDMMNLRTK